MKKVIDDRQVLENIGRTGEIARLCKVRSQAVSIWKKNNLIPPARRMYLIEIRPEAFGYVPRRERILP